MARLHTSLPSRGSALGTGAQQDRNGQWPPLTSCPLKATDRKRVCSLTKWNIAVTVTSEHQRYTIPSVQHYFGTAPMPSNAMVLDLQ